VKWKSLRNEPIHERLDCIVGEITSVGRPFVAVEWLGPDEVRGCLPVADMWAIQFELPTVGPTANHKLKAKLSDECGYELNMVRWLTWRGMDTGVGDV
jgi:hypothetical protein